MPHLPVKPVFDAKVRELCTRPYPLHPKGCPNFGARASCPPDAPLLELLLQPGEPVWAAYNVFNLAAHVERLRKIHPDWSERTRE